MRGPARQVKAPLRAPQLVGKDAGLEVIDRHRTHPGQALLVGRAVAFMDQMPAPLQQRSDCRRFESFGHLLPEGLRQHHVFHQSSLPLAGLSRASPFHVVRCSIEFQRLAIITNQALETGTVRRIAPVIVHRPMAPGKERVTVFLKP